MITRIDSWYLYQDRLEELNNYFNFLFSVLDEKPKIKYKDHECDFDRDLLHMLKSNGMLIIYNLVESTMTNAIKDIHFKLKSESDLCIDKLNVSLAKYAFKKIHNLTLDTIEDNTIATLVTKNWLESHDIFVENNKHPLISGNLDARRIKEIGAFYEFSTETDTDITKDGFSLLEIKTSRNQLAHGETSFKEKGTTIDIESLKSIRNEATKYLEELLVNIEQYIVNKIYLREDYR